LQHLTYLESKKKPVKKGIVQNFWYKRGNEFLFVKLINLDENRAYGGELFRVNGKFQLVSVMPFKQASFEVGNGKITLSVPKAVEYTPGGVKAVKNLRYSFNYDLELLRVREPKFFSIGDLIKLLLLSKSLGINPTPFMWELEKRILIALFILWVFLYGGINFFKAYSGKEVLREVVIASVLTLAFYTALFIYQSALTKLSLNPFWFLLIVPIYGFFIVRGLKEG
jgi:lipopolysaccharide export LptBFGC system permease protein LptF